MDWEGKTETQYRLALAPAAGSGAQPGKCEFTHAHIEKHTAGRGVSGDAKCNHACASGLADAQAMIGAPFVCPLRNRQCNPQPSRGQMLGRRTGMGSTPLTR